MRRVVLSLGVAVGMMVTFAAFSADPVWKAGAWSGRWSSMHGDPVLPSTLKVETVTANTASGIYEWGDAPSWKIKAGSEKFGGKLDANTLTFTSSAPGKPVFTFTLNADGTVTGYRTVGARQNVGRITMTPVK